MKNYLPNTRFTQCRKKTHIFRFSESNDGDNHRQKKTDKVYHYSKVFQSPYVTLTHTSSPPAVQKSSDQQMHVRCTRDARQMHAILRAPVRCSAGRPGASAPGPATFDPHAVGAVCPALTSQGQRCSAALSSPSQRSAARRNRCRRR